ncbi:Pigment protein [Actinokineospora spheciospongiae]|uniref:Pigment protein n=1 Tax=Actinokineospora spheciospongiae TaxID=909613 RepID=W7IJX1_9PSEU|nr:hypothetical protein [Actinokineospora spheciospongiae]EWC60648.1 Pigment protein [Actinokineospora spheciospongiae]
MPENEVPLSTAAVDVAEVASGLSAEMYRQRRLGPEVFEAVLGAGFLRHFVPAGFGGRDGTFRQLLPAVALIGERCPATAWCASLFASTPRFLALFPQAARREFWADGPDTAVVCSVLPFGEAVAERGGWRVSGRWPYLSGIEFAEWAVLCAKVLVDGEPVLKLVAVPREACRVEETWFSVGMQATGSNTAVLEDVFVPAHRVVGRETVFAGRPVDPAGEPAAPVAPLPAVNGLTFVVPALGAARGALALLSAHVARKVRDAPVLPGAPGAQGNLATWESVLARSSAEIDAVGLLLERIADVADRGDVTPAEVARGARDAAFAIDVLTGAVNRIFRAAGTGGQVADGLLQRLWRDVNSISTHQALQFEPAARNYTRTACEPAG